MRKKSVVLLSTSLLLLLSACGHKAAASNTQTAKFMATDVIASMDSAQYTDFISCQALTDTFAGLYRYDGSKLTPDMASKMATVSKDQKTYTFTLRKGAKWSDGKPVTATDFEYACKRVIAPSTKSAYAYIFSGIENADAIMAGHKPASTLGVKATGKYTLQVHLDRVMPYFQSMLTLQTFDPVEKSFVEKVGHKYATSSKYLHFNGPYALKNWSVANSSWTEAKNPHYWNAKKYHLTTLKYTVVKDNATAMNLYSANKIDDIAISGNYAQQSRSDPGYNIVKLPNISYLKMNTQKVPAFKSSKVRQAISLAINRKSFITNVLGDGSTPAKTMVPTNMFYNSKTGKDFGIEAAKGVSAYTDYDLGKARQLFKEGMAETGQTSLNFTLLSNDEPATKNAAEYLQNALGKLATDKLSVHITNKAVPRKTWLAQGRTFSYGMMLRDWGADFPDAINFLSLFASSTENFSGNWSSPHYDALIKTSDGADAANVNKRWSDLLKADQLLTKDQGVIPVYQWGTAHLTKSTLKDVKYAPNGMRSYAGATNKTH